MTPRTGACLNVQGAQNAHFWDRGIARYIVEHCRALMAVAPDAVHSVRASPDLGFTPSLVGLLPSGRVHRTHAEPVREDGTKPAIYHVMSPLEWGHPIDDIWPVWARDPDVTLVVTLYDLIPLLFPERYSKRPHERVAYDVRLELVRRADHLLAISQHTADDAIRELGTPPERITVIDAAASTSFLAAWPRIEDATAFVRERFPRIDRDFVFYVGGMDERKNLPRLVEAWSNVPKATRERTCLVVTCELRPEARGALERLAARGGLRPGDLVLTGRVDDRELAALYRSCRLFCFASLYEGSGLPILEAMTAEAPVVAARTSTGPEILGELDGTFDPEDALDMARVLDSTLNDEQRLGRFRDRSRRRIGDFSWERVATRTLAGYEAALAARRPVRPRLRRARPRVAVLAPGPRPACAADAALRRLSAALEQVADVDLLAADGDGASRYAVGRSAGRYDGTIHVLGDTPAHRLAYETLIAAPGGIALFEDVSLAAFHRWYGKHVGTVIWSRRQLEQQYGGMLPGWIALRGEATAEEARTHGLLFSHEAQAAARSILAPCGLAAELLRIDRRGRDLPAPIEVLTPPAPAADDAAPAAGRLPLLVAAEPPGDDGAALLVRALARLREDVPAARLALIAPGTRPEREDLERLAAELGVDGAVDLAPADARADLVARAAVAVLPTPAVDAGRIAFAGECLAAGTPLVGAALGWVDGTPATVVTPLPADPTASQIAAAAAPFAARPGADAERAAAARRYAATELAPPPGARLLELLGLS